MSVDNKYDLGESTSPYFSDKNKGCKETKSEQYCDCKNNPFCVTKEEDLPYIQAHEILPPVFISTTWGSEKFYKAKVKSVEKKKGKTYLHIDKPLQVGDVIKVAKDGCPKYFIKSKNRARDKFNNFIVEIIRLDGFNIVSLDLEKFKNTPTIIVKGYMKDVKK